jgi:hypothetical protein
VSRRLDLADRMRRTGLQVIEVAGWRDRGSPTFNPRGSVCHHTAGARSGVMPSLNILINGRPDLPGPLCNVGLGRDLAVRVIAAGRANHAGSGGWAGLAGNSSVWGLEVEHVGTNAEPVTAELWDAMVRIHAELARGNYPASMVCQHKEWAPNRKVDFFAVNGDSFRAGVAQHLSDATPPPPVQEDDMPAVLAHLEGDPAVWALTPSGRWWVPNQRLIDFGIFTGMFKGNVVVIGAADRVVLDAWPIIASPFSDNDIARIVAATPTPRPATVAISPADIAALAKAVAGATPSSGVDPDQLAEAIADKLAARIANG